MQTFSIIGCGRVGISLAVFLSRAGYEATGFSSRSETSAETAQKAVGSGNVFDSPEAAAKSAEIVFITTPDTLIEPVCTQIAESGGIRPGQVVLHCSGALSSEILASAAAAGAHTGSIHPLQSFAAYAQGQSSPFRGINMSVEGDAVASKAGIHMIRDLKAQCVAIPTRAKTLYHAAAVVASNYLVTVENAALQLLGKAGISEPRAFEILEPLIQGTLANIRKQGIEKALTGPIARGDSQIVADHLEAMAGNLSGIRELYRFLGNQTLDIAVARGVMDTASVEKLRQLLGREDLKGHEG